MAKKDRSNGYYLRRLEKEHPAIFADLKLGRIKSPAKALQIAGIKRAPGPLSVLKREWGKASPKDRVEFLKWARARIASSTPTSVAVSGASASTPSFLDCRCTAEGKERIELVMMKRKLRTGQIMSEIGFNPLDTSLATALGLRSRISPAMIVELETWLEKNKTYWTR